MRKKVLILVLSGDFPPYRKMVETSIATWDSIQVDGVETAYYFGRHKHSEPLHISGGWHLPIEETYNNIGKKTLTAFSVALKDADFDYVARVNSSTYVNKKKLIEHIQTLPDENLFSGMIVKNWHHVKHSWPWGPAFIISKDVVKKLADNKDWFDSSMMEDVGIGDLAGRLGIPLTDGKACSIDYLGDDKWRCLCYGTESFEFTNFEDVKKADQYFFRCKHDPDRNKDEFIMRKLFENL